MRYFALAAAAFAACASARVPATPPAGKIISIAVGKSRLSFLPDTVTAQVGDVLEFLFYPTNHSVAQGSWDKGCAPDEDGFFSGFFRVGGGMNLMSFRVTVNDTDPLVFYCTTGRHCQGGMYGVVNPANDSTLAAYAALAEKATDNVTPSSTSGGTLSFNISGPGADGRGNGSRISIPDISTSGAVARLLNVEGGIWAAALLVAGWLA